MHTEAAHQRVQRRRPTPWSAPPCATAAALKRLMRCITVRSRLEYCAVVNVELTCSSSWASRRPAHNRLASNQAANVSISARFLQKQVANSRSATCHVSTLPSSQLPPHMRQRTASRLQGPAAMTEKFDGECAICAERSTTMLSPRESDVAWWPGVRARLSFVPRTAASFLSSRWR